MITPEEELVSHGWQDLSGKLNRDPIPPNSFFTDEKHGRLKSLLSGRRRWMSAAAVLTLLVTGATLYYKKASGRLQIDKEVSSSALVAWAGYGAVSKLVLADGTKVWLNAGSKLIYPQIFSGPKREVTLEGEAFFQVAKDTKAPFSVRAGKLTVGVLGTSFNVKAYRDDANIETTLICGKIQVVLEDDPEKRIVLSPHEKLTVSNSMASGKLTGIGTLKEEPAASNVVVPVKAYNALRYQVQTLPHDSSNNFAETAWLNDKLVISNESFETVGRMLERKYNVHVRFENESIRQEHISGVFDKEGIGKVLQILKMTTRFNYRMGGDTVYLYKRERLVKLKS